VAYEADCGRDLTPNRAAAWKLIKKTTLIGLAVWALLLIINAATGGMLQKAADNS
jgi:hypothetical protein